MLRELQARQVEGEPPRRWFADDYFDLYVWSQPDNSMLGFQLCYDKGHDERALTWLQAGTFRHERVDTGETAPLESRTPVLGGAGDFDGGGLRAKFAERSSELEGGIRELVFLKIAEFEGTA